MVKIGDCLPRFKEYEDLFKNKPRVSHVLCLFYQDILDFYVTCLKFFKVKGILGIVIKG